MRDDLRRRLADLGASDGDMARAEEGGWLPLLALDRLLVTGAAIYDAAALAREAGLDEEYARRLWRAVGFPDVPNGIPLFTKRDVDAARLLVEQASPRDLETGVLLQQVRVISGSLARVAAVEADGFADFVLEARSAGLDDEAIALAVFGDVRFANISVLIEYVHRLQLRAAIWRRLALDAEPDLAIAVGFADLSGYTELSAALDAEHLSQLVGRWEDIAFDTLAAYGARVVKTIGDEVMFVGLPPQAVAAGVALRDAAARAGLPALRIGIAAGPVIPRDGDFYGPVVNLASRLTEIAQRGDVLVPAAIRPVIGDPAELVFTPLGIRELRSIGPVEVFAVSTAG